MDFYNCLDDYSINYDDLLKIHTGHQDQLSDSDSDAKSEKSEKDYWPSLYTSEQLKANVVNAKDLKEESSNTAKLNPTYLKVAKTLNTMVTNQFCYICKKNGTGHYMAQCHYNKVLAWIKIEAQTKDPNVLKMIYCQVCNIGLDKNDNHYSTESHQRNIPFYCDLCNTKFKSPITQGHFDKRHSGIIPPKFKQIPTTTQPTKTKATIPYTPSSANCTNHQRIAERLQNLLTFTACLVCGKTHLPTQKHYTTKKHIKKMRCWIQDQAPKFGFPVENSERLYCQICVDIFSSDEIAEAHYQSQKHKSNLPLYCTLCDKSVKDMNRHVQQACHKRRKEKNKKLNTAEDQNTSWPHELAYLITLSKCDICLLKFENHNEAYNHYISKEHQDNVSAWIANLENNKSTSKEPIEIIQMENPEQTILRNKIVDELRYAIDKLYFSNAIPLKEALAHLMRLNRDIADICNKRKKDESIICEAPPKPRTSVGDTSVEFTNFKLTMELERLKTVLGKIDLIPPQLGIIYTEKLVQVMKSLADGDQSVCINYDDIDRIFDVSSCDLFELDFSYHTKFQEKLDTLESIITGENRKISSDVALNVITQFNLKLESSIDNCHDDDTDYFGSSDDDNLID